MPIPVVNELIKAGELSKFRYSQTPKSPEPMPAREWKKDASDKWKYDFPSVGPTIPR